MIPLRDENPTRTNPWVTQLLVVSNIAVFAYEFLLGMRGGNEALVAFIQSFGLRPDYLLSPTAWGETPVAVPLTMFTSMFVHAGLLHLIGNMLYLWIFGDNVEDAMGHARFLLFYLLCGLGAAVAQVVVSPGSSIPMVGASGAIAGVLGAYVILYPNARVLTLVFLIVFIRVMYLPAIVLLGIWFLLQILSAVSGGGGVAWYAHIGGFVVGVLLVGSFIAGGRPRGGRRRRRGERPGGGNLYTVH